MGKSFTMIDAEAFARTSQLFQAKRGALAPSAVERLASEIVDRIARSARTAPRFQHVAVSADSVSDFCDCLIQVEPDAALQFIENRRAEGVTRQGVYFGYVAAAAQQLGRRWDRGRLSAEQVTIGTGHLYALMRALRAEMVPTNPNPDARKCALFATVPGEQHGIGITIAADLFREAGWDIDLQVGTDHDSLVARTEGTLPPIIGLSLSTDQQLACLVRLVVAIRIVHPYAVIGVAPGSSADEKKVVSLADVDLVFRDARAACIELDRLIRLRG